MELLLTRPNADPCFGDDPEPTGNWLALEQIQHMLHDAQDMVSALFMNAEHNQSRIGGGWKRANIGKIEIKRDQDAAVAQAVLREGGIVAAAESLGVNGMGVVAGDSQ